MMEIESKRSILLTILSNLATYIIYFCTNLLSGYSQFQDILKEADFGHLKELKRLYEDIQMEYEDTNSYVSKSTCT